MKRILVFTLILMLLFSAAACGTKSGPSGSQEGASPAADKATYVIQAGGLELKYPEQWKDKVTVTVTDVKAAFACGETQLFDILFNAGEGVVLGTVRGETNTVISVVDYPLEREDPELVEMQMDVNVILQNLESDYDFIPYEAAPDETTATFDIETSVATLKYPAKWQDKVKVEVSEKTVSFAAGETKLFDLVFEECDGYLLGTYDGTPIYIVEYPVTTDEEIRMVQDVNVILQHLSEDSSFVSA